MELPLDLQQDQRILIPTHFFFHLYVTANNQTTGKNLSSFCAARRLLSNAPFGIFPRTGSSLEELVETYELGL